MKPKVLFLGSIGVVSETSDIQRRAYNTSMKEHGLNWEWSREVYPQLLQTSGGIQRLETLAAATNQSVDSDTVRNIHSSKTDIACKEIVDKRVPLRPGILDLIKAARNAGAKIAWVTSTNSKNTSALLEASGGALKAEDFDRIFHREDAENGKPSPDIYNVALEHFNVSPGECLAIEDSVDSILAARGAGIYTIATLGANHQGVSVANVADESYASAADIPLERFF